MPYWHPGDSKTGTFSYDITENKIYEDPDGMCWDDLSEKWLWHIEYARKMVLKKKKEYEEGIEWCERMLDDDTVLIDALTLEPDRYA